jgi:predicted XRE-type DNA-binding protein
MTEDTQDIPVIDSCGNIFADLNVKDPEEALAKAKLVQQIAAIVRDRKLTQAAAAKICGIDQPKVSKLLKGELYGFSTEQLMKFLTAFGQDVEIVVTAPSGRRRSKGRLTVRAA